jgi:PAS domain S-box-containing protein
MGTPIAVLIVEDSESDAQLVARLLRKGGYDVTFERIDSAEQMHLALEKQSWDIVISDYSLPRFNGYAALHLLQEKGWDIPFIIVSGAIGEENAAGLMKSGVHDYLMKHNLTRLVPVVKRELAQAETRRERTRATKDLRESNERYQTLAQVSPVGIFHTDANGSTTYVNPEWCHISGVSADEALGDSWLSAVHPEDRESLRTGWQSAIQADKVSSSEYRFVRPDGSTAWVMGQAVPLKNAEGQTTGYVGTITDITERKRVEQQLRASREYLERVLNTLGDPVLVKDARHRFVLVNEAQCALLGYGREELLGKTDNDFFPRDQVDVFWEMDDRVLRTGEENTNEETLTDQRTGELRTVITRKTLYVDPVGDRFVVAAIRDITERKRAEEALRQSEEKYRSLMEHSGAGVLFFSTDGTLLFVNKTVARAHGGKPEDFVGKSMLDVLGKDTATLHMHRMKVVVTNQYPEEYEDSVVLTHGTRWLLSSYARVVDKSGAVIGVQIVSHDITERKQAEMALRKSEAEIRMLYETMRDGFVSTDMQGHILQCNNAYCDLLGYTQEEISRLAYQDFTPGQWIDVDAMMIREQIVPRGYSDIYEKEYRTKDGANVPIELRAVLVRDEEGKPAGMWAIVRDITERKQVEEALRNSQRSTEAILNSLTSHIAVLDQAGTIVSVNDAWFRFAIEEGVTDPAVVGVGANYFDACRKAITDTGDELAERALKGITDVLSHDSATFYQEYPCHSPDKKRWFIMRVSPILGTRSGIVITHENITERKHAEMRIQDLADQLRRFSTHLESAREEERMHIAREIHDELGQALTALKMDLTDIHGSDAHLSDRTRHRLSTMGKLIDQTAVAVQRLAGELRPPMLDELGLIAAVSWYIQDFEERSGIACTRVRFDDEPSADRTRATALYRVLQESLTNVARHSNATEVEIRLEFTDGSALLEIADNGKGITNEELKNLDSIGILGMRERLQRLGGRLEIHGVPGSGTTVRATMPWPT